MFFTQISWECFSPDILPLLINSDRKFEYSPEHQQLVIWGEEDRELKKAIELAVARREARQAEIQKIIRDAHK